ncbi:MAG: signal peptide peptidase SppA [bacterium]
MKKRRRRPALPVLSAIMSGRVIKPVMGRMIGKVRIVGPVMPAVSGYPHIRGTHPDRVIQKIMWAKSRGLRGLIVEINSPGGAVVSCREIADAIKAAKMATVAWVRDLGASGAYWIASACKRIVADPCSTVGSIGVLSHHLEISELMKRYGVRYEGFKSGQYKDMGIPFRKTTEKERGMINEHLRSLHETFVNEIARNRGMDVSKVKRISKGQVFLGDEAKKIGLVDKTGGREEAVRQCEIVGNFKSLMVIEIEDFREELMFFLRGLLPGAPMSSGAELARAVAETLRFPGYYAL